VRRLALLILLTLSLPACFIVVVDANGNNSNPFNDGGIDAGLVRREEPGPTRLADISPMGYISGAH
jgi:hypothetical protein